MRRWNEGCNLRKHKEETPEAEGLGKGEEESEALELAFLRFVAREICILENS